MPQYYDNEEFDFESNTDLSNADRPGCYPKPYPPCPPSGPPGGQSQVAGAQAQQANNQVPAGGNLMYCFPIGANNLNQVAGAQSQPQVAGAQSPYNASPYGGPGAPGYYPPYPYYGGYAYGWVWAVVVIVVILLIICGLWWWYGGWR